MAALTGVRSVSGHVLPRADHAEDHCHVGNVGNVGLSLDIITGWLDRMSRIDTKSADRLQDTASSVGR